MTQTILTVCTANICRSPAMSFMLRRELERRVDASAIDWGSAGTDARPGALICADFRHRVAGTEGWREFSIEHASRLLTTEKIDAADLILAAGAVERGKVALLRPSARSRSFTLLEAAALAEFAVAQGERIVEPGASAAAAMLNAQRGKLAFPHEKPRRRWSRAVPVDPYSVPDAHTSPASHDRVLGDISSGAARLALALDSLGFRAS